MSADLENSAVATGLEKVIFHSHPKKGQCQRVFRLPHNCIHFTCQQGNVRNPSSQSLAVREPRPSRCSSWIQKKQRNQRSNCQHMLIIEMAYDPTYAGSQKKQENSKKASTFASLTTLKPLIVWITTNYGKLLKRWTYPMTSCAS